MVTNGFKLLVNGLENPPSDADKVVVVAATEVAGSKLKNPPAAGDAFTAAGLVKPEKLNGIAGADALFSSALGTEVVLNENPVKGVTAAVDGVATTDSAVCWLNPVELTVVSTAAPVDLFVKVVKLNVANGGTVSVDGAISVVPVD